MNNINQQYQEQGYCVGAFNQTQAIEQLSQLCLDYLAKKFQQPVPLASYHLFCRSDEEHRELHFELSELVKQSRLHKQLVRDNLAIFHGLVGSDLDLQVDPYLRISRPNISEDNIGLHRDTFYGNTAYEISCVVPLADFASGCGVNVMAESHHQGPLEYDQVPHPSIVKGSKQNQIGFLYSTKKIKNLNREMLVAPILKKGEFLMFSLCMIHGQEVNSAEITRWSFDFRFRNSFTPLNENLKANYYQHFTQSPASKVSQAYYTQNPDELIQMKNTTLLNPVKN